MKITWKTERIKVKDLIPADYNPRKISEKERADLTESIKEFSEVEPVVANTNNHLIGGHQRVSIYADLGIEEIDVRIPSRKLSTEEEMRLNLRLNKNTASWDEEKLQDLNVNMLLDVGFGEDELAYLWNNLETESDGHKMEKEIEAAKKTEIKTGDIFQLGEHRLLCGDSTNETDVNKVMNGEKAGMVYCDPPYNIGLSYAGGIGTENKYQGTYKDNKKDADYAEFLEETIRNAIRNALPDVHVFYWCDEKYIGMLQKIFEEEGIDNKRVCLWIKNNQNPTPQIAFNKVYEPCVYGTRGRPYLNGNYRAFNEVLNKEVESGNQLQDDIQDLFNIWLVDRDPSKDYDHPTQKPITLHEKALKRCTAPGTIVVDLFGGSGSTLMACEQMRRKCYTVEMSPIFCQVIINRWEQYTGKKVKKI